MRDIRRIAGLGVAFGLSASAGLAQPAATLGKAIEVDDPRQPVVRAAPPAPAGTGVTPLFSRGLLRQPASGTGGTAQPGGGTTTLPPPRPADGQPNVTEQRGTTTAPPPTTTYPIYPSGPAATMGAPMPVGVVPSAPTPMYSYPSYVVPGSGVTVPGPVVGPQPCDPATGVPYGAFGGGMPIPVSPSSPAVGYGQTVPAPAIRLEDPYLVSPYNPLFPRARAAVANTASALLSPFNRLTLGGEYLLWYTRAQDAPPLLTTSSPANNGIIGQGDTRVIFGQGNIADTLHSGARFSGVFRLTDLWALDGNVWFLGRNGRTFNAGSDQYPVLARPFFNVNTGQNFSQLIAFPGVATGAAQIDYDTQLWGAEANFRRGVLCGPCSRLDALVGFRYLNLAESLEITERFARTPNSPPSIGVPTALSGVVTDRFRTENHFYGVNVGLAGEMHRGWWFLQGRAAVGLGTIYQQVNTNGSQVLNTTSGVTQTAGGLLVLPGANLGNFSQAKFGVVPDVGLTVGLHLTPNLRFGVGYNFMYVNSVVRPPNQIDTGLDVTRIPNFPVTPTPPAISGVRPTVPMRTSDFFAQGVTFSLFWTW
jgi:hypothetical protein